MICTHCGLWELAEGDLVCCWCSASYLRFTVDLQPDTLSTQDYPPPVALHVCNQSPMGAITLERIDCDQNWASLLPNQALPQRITPGTQHVFHVDVDTFALEKDAAVSITVSALHCSEVRSAVLLVRAPEASAAQQIEHRR